MIYKLTIGAVGAAITCFLADSCELSAQDIRTAPATVTVPFDAAQSKATQQAWADHLGVPVMSTNSIGMKFVVIPPGKFSMGSHDSEPGRRDEERQHVVTLILGSKQDEKFY